MQANSSSLKTLVLRAPLEEGATMAPVASTSAAVTTRHAGRASIIAVRQIGRRRVTLRALRNRLSGHGFRLEVAREPALAHQRGFMRAEGGHDAVERHVGERAAIVQIFHVEPAR